SYFQYLSAFPEPNAAIVLVADETGGESILFCREKNEERETWEGRRFGPAAAAEHFGFDRALPIGELDVEMPRLLGDRATFWYALGSDDALDTRVRRWMASVRAQARAGVGAPTRAIDLRARLDEMRLIKDADEIATMRRAAQISAAAHVRAMKAARP